MRTRHAHLLALLLAAAGLAAAAAVAARPLPRLAPAAAAGFPGEARAAAAPARGPVAACGTGSESSADALARHLARGPLAALPTTHSGDLGEIAVLEDDGTFFFTTSGGTPVLDLAAVSRAFYRTHGDDYDALAVWLASGLTTWFGVPGALAAAYVVRNDVDGIGLERADLGEGFGSPARLQILLSMNGLHRYADDPWAPGGVDEFTTLDFLAHEFAHRFTAYAWVESAGAPSPALLGRAYQHWNFFADVDGSVMEGCDWTQVGPDSFRTTGVTTGFGRLDLYLMGLASKAETDSVLVVNDPSAFDPPDIYVPWSVPRPGLGCRGRATWWTVDDIEAVHGPRVPEAAAAPHAWRVGFALVVPRGAPASAADLAKLEAIRSAFPAWFAAATAGRGSVDATLDSRPGAVTIAHEPLRDTEDVLSPRVVTARIAVEPGGLPAALDPAALRLHWRVAGGAWNAAPLAPAGPDSFAAVLPAPGAAATVEYWIEAGADAPGVVAFEPPAGAAAPHAFKAGPDVTPPEVRHAPVASQAAARLPQTLLARATDNLGVAAVWLERSVNGGAPETLPAARVGRDSFAVAVGAGLAEGDHVAYRFVARDASAAGLTAASSAGFDTLRVGRDWTHDVENGADGWFHAPYWYSYRDAWHTSPRWASAPGGTSWRCGSTDGTPYPPHLDANLYSPLIAELPPGTLLRFDHRYELEAAGPGRAWDGARVEVQVANGPWQIAMPAAGYTHGFVLNTNPFQRDTPCWSGTSGFRSEVVDLTPFSPGPARIRFRMLADDYLGLDGWHVDRVRLSFPDGPLVAAPAPRDGPVVGAPRPNPAAHVVGTTIALTAAAQVVWALFDVQGRRVATLWDGPLAPGARDLEAWLPAALPAGLYFSRVALDGRPAAIHRLALVR
uniref:T9SS type A sorting domain-containing protein n=1 Tax=Eiseniibacteriota bacterium TaxID=2212470 RepID=A0A832ML88_UNCEI